MDGACSQGAEEPFQIHPLAVPVIAHMHGALLTLDGTASAPRGSSLNPPSSHPGGGVRKGFTQQALLRKADWQVWPPAWLASGNPGSGRARSILSQERLAAPGLFLQQHSVCRTPAFILRVGKTVSVWPAPRKSPGHRVSIEIPQKKRLHAWPPRGVTCQQGGYVHPTVISRERKFELWPSRRSPSSCAVTNDRLSSVTPPSTSLDLGAVSGTQVKDGSGSHPHIAGVLGEVM